MNFDAKRLAILAFALALTAGPARIEAADVGFEVFPGAPLILASSLDISQDGHPDLNIDPDFATEPLEPPWYYALRLSLWRGDRAWAVDLLHQKLMLRDPPPEVQHFEISHGYNIFTVQRLWLRGATVLSAGAGVVVAHPENTVRGLVLDEKTGLGGWGYHMAGFAISGGVGRRIPMGEHFHLAGETRLVASRVEVPVANGRAVASDLTAHFLLGVGVNF